MLQAILNAITGVLDGVFDVIGSVFSGVGALFYTPGAEGAAGSLTILGEVLAWSGGVALVAAGAYLIFRLVRNIVGRLGGSVRGLGR